MKYIELMLGVLLVGILAIYITGFVIPNMMLSGAILFVLCVYLGLLWQEKVVDERDEYIRSRTDRYLYMTAIAYLVIDIAYSVLNHTEYTKSLTFLAILCFAKLILSKVIKEKN